VHLDPRTGYAHSPIDLHRNNRDFDFAGLEWANNDADSEADVIPPSFRGEIVVFSEMRYQVVGLQRTQRAPMV
jgi:hypothetical protein